MHFNTKQLKKKQISDYVTLPMEKELNCSVPIVYFFCLERVWWSTDNRTNLPPAKHCNSYAKAKQGHHPSEM